MKILAAIDIKMENDTLHTDKCFYCFFNSIKLAIEDIKDSDINVYYDTLVFEHYNYTEMQIVILEEIEGSISKQSVDKIIKEKKLQYGF